MRFPAPPPFYIGYKMIYAVHFIDNNSGSDPGWVELIDFEKIWKVRYKDVYNSPDSLVAQMTNSLIPAELVEVFRNIGKVEAPQTVLGTMRIGFA